MLSLLPHKEFRFLLPSMPGFGLLLAFCVLRCWKHVKHVKHSSNIQNSQKVHNVGGGTSGNASASGSAISSYSYSYSCFMIGLLLLLCNLVFGCYMISFHQAGGEVGFAILRDKLTQLAHMTHVGDVGGIMGSSHPMEQIQPPDTLSLDPLSPSPDPLSPNPLPIVVYALAPCYSFPGVAFLHSTVQIRSRLQLHMPECYTPDDPK